MAQVQEAQTSRRRRRRSSRQKGSWADYIRGEEFARLVFFGMCLLAAAYAAKFVYDTRMASIYYNGLVVSASEQDARYVFGPPQAIEDGGRVYRYDDGKRVIQVRFSQSGRLTSLICSADEKNTTQCEERLDIRLGQQEDQILLALGAPSRVSYAGDDKILHYDGLGLSFLMRKYKLYGIELREGGNFIGYLPRAVWRMIP